ncbi:MAG: DUF1631 domain-containing protein [Stenotrophomonas sp.]
MSGTTATSSNQALARIAAAPVPPRVRQLLEAIHGVAAQALTPHLQLTTVQLERELFNQAEKARNSQIQSDIYAQIRQLGVHSAQLPVWFLDTLAEEIAGLREPVVATKTPTPVRAMTLVTDTDIDRDIVLHEMARRESLRAQSHLQLLGQRFGVLAAQPAFDVERLPVGPYGLCRILRQCGERLELDTFAQLQLYHVFERQVLDLLVELLDRLNILLAREGVLPGLVYIPYLPRPSAPRRGGVGAAPGGDTPMATQRPLTQWQGQAPAMSWSAAALAADVAPGNAASPSATTGAAGAVADTGIAAVHELLNSARQLLARNLQSGGAATSGANAGDLGDMMAALGNLANQAAAAGSGTLPPGAGTGGSARASAPSPPTRPVPSEAVASVLERLQSQAAAPGTRRSFGDIHSALLSQVRAEHGENAVLSPRDGNTLDLLGLLYTQIQHEVRSTGPAADLLTRLQVPLARAALGDEAFFVREQHPARELLNTVAEAGAVWLGEDDDDPVLLQKLDEVVEQVVNDYQGDEAVFAEANQKVQAHLHSAARKAELTERRQVEAARGKERLEAAKQLAGRTIGQLCQSADPPKFVQTLLHEAWSDVLTLTLLRRGEDSEEWQQQQQATRRIGEITADPAGEADAALGEQIEQSLLQVGYHQDEAGAIARRLSAPGGEDPVTSKTELASKLKARARLGAGDSKGSAGEGRAKPPTPRTTDEEARYRQLRTLPFGTWFEFVTNQQGDSRRLRLSWYSLITDHALFVNARGQKVAEHTLDALARLMANNQLRIVTEDRARLIDRAWQATLRALRSLTGGTTPEPAA